MKSQKLFPKSIKIYYCSPKYLGYKKTNLRPCCCFIKILALESLGSHKILPLEGSCEFSETQPYLCNLYSTQWAYSLSPAIFNNLLDLALSKSLLKILSEVFRKTKKLLYQVLYVDVGKITQSTLMYKPDAYLSQL